MYKNNTIYLLIIAISFVLFSNYSEDVQYNNYNSLLKAKKERIELKKQTAIERAKWEFMMLRDPNTNEIPRGIFAKEQKFARLLPKRSEKVLFKTGSAQNAEAISWQERGPNNLGGRTRAFAADSRNSSIIIAGGVSGGIWRTTNGGTNWTLRTNLSQLPTISCIVQDPTAKDTWYAGTGEQANSMSAAGASYFGNGIYKSTDNGLSWAVLGSTTGNVYTWDNDWEYVNSIGISPTTGTIFAAVNSSIRRSVDDGATWQVVLGGVNQLSRSEVTVNTAGDIYASISSNADNSGIYKSTTANDGVSGTWTNITPVGGTNSATSFPTDYRRVILAHAPSDNNIVYIFAYTPGAGQQKPAPSNDGSSFWKYDASQTGTSQWVDRSLNLPAWVGPVGGMDTQGGYNMFLAVSQTDPIFVIIGATNLFRSTDGFATAAGLISNNWIGGYAITNDISQYANQHPDQHSGFFGTGTNFFSGHDGGLSQTTDITANPVVWTNIDNTYNVAQFYTVSLAPETSSNYLSGGLQDNGARFTAGGGLANWTEWQGGGDGAFTDVAPSGDDVVFTSTQNGNTDKFTRTNGYLGEITPTGSTNKLFINPFILDPNSSSFLYYGAGNSGTTSGIWRNNDAINATTTTGWQFIASTTVTKDVDGNITAGQTSAIDVSYTNSANVVYFGTIDGKVYKITNANTAAPSSPTPLTALPSSGYVSGIAIDPLNSDNVMVVLSNYGIASIFYTSNGGGSWTNIEGNLASADGPSLRSCEIFQVSGVTHYFVGTSIGLYYTLTPTAGATWTQEASTTIGNVICASLDWRSDAGTIAKTASPNDIKAVTAVSLAVGTHGRGVFQGTINAPLPVELTTFAGLYNGKSVELQWQTATEVNNYGFEIERTSIPVSSNTSRTETKDWKKIGFVSGSGNSNSPKHYSFADINLFGSEKFYYRLKQIDIDGKFEYSSIVEISINIDGYKLSQNYPNPFNPSTKINYTIPESADVKVEVYSITGELVARLINANQNAGNYSIEFNSTNNVNLSTGMYVYRISAKGISGNNFVKTRKMLLIK